MSEAIRINTDDLTIGDLEDFERIVGKDLFDVLPATAEAGKNWRPSAKAIKALVYLVKRRDNPDFTEEQARDVKVSELLIGDSDDDERPTGAGETTG